MAEIIATTERLVLRTEAEGDFEEWLAHMNTPEVMVHLGGPQSEEWVAERFVKLRKAHEGGGPSFYLVALKDRETLIGWCGLGTIDTPAAPEALNGALQIGWTLRADHWGKGYAGEAAQAALGLAFERHAAPLVYAQTSDSNRASWRLMDKLGMSRTQELDYIDPAFPPEDNPTIIYRITQDKWRLEQAQ